MNIKCCEAASYYNVPSLSFLEHNVADSMVEALISLVKGGDDLMGDGTVAESPPAQNNMAIATFVDKNLEAGVQVGVH